MCSLLNLTSNIVKTISEIYRSLENLEILLRVILSLSRMWFFQAKFLYVPVYKLKIPYRYKCIYLKFLCILSNKPWTSTGHPFVFLGGPRDMPWMSLSKKKSPQRPLDVYSRPTWTNKLDYTWPPKETSLHPKWTSSGCPQERLWIMPVYAHNCTGTTGKI